MGFFDDEMKKLAVWAKGRPIIGRDPAQWRMDHYGSIMLYSAYGDRNNPLGWEFDHIDPNGPDELWNLRPLYWGNNARKSDKPPSLTDFGSSPLLTEFLASLARLNRG